MRILAWFPLAFIGALILIFSLLNLNEMNRAVFFEPSKKIEMGSRFGVAIGDPRKSVRENLNSGFDFEQTMNGGQCLKAKYAPSEKIDLYLDDSWRMGATCIIYDENDRVKSMEWYFTPFAI